jgi:Alginate export
MRGRKAQNLCTFRRGCAAALFAWLLLPAVADAQYFALGKGTYPLEFYDIDFSSLANPANRITPLDQAHYVPLGIDPDTYLSLGGDVRQQFWSWSNEGHGLKSPRYNTYDLSRLLFDAYLHLNRHVALFAQLGRFDAIGKDAPLNAADASRGRLQQGFVEIKQEIGPAEVTTRAGRQEITLGSGRFVWVNDSSNIRTTHDGVRVHADFGGNGTLDLVYSRPVVPTLDAFSDWDSHAGTFGAAYLSESVIPNRLHVDEYYYFRHDSGAQYAGLTGNEDRDTVGGRVWGAFGSFKYDSDFAVQFGTFDGRPISALGTSTRVLYSFQSLFWQPGLQFQASYFSGTGQSSATIGTFSAPFGRPTMLNYAGLETLENLVEAYPAVIVNPTSDLALRFGPEAVWRASVYDAVYISRTTPLLQTVSANDRASYIGTNLVATAQWKILANVSLFAEYLHELAGPAITLAGGHGADVGIAQIDVNF